MSFHWKLGTRLKYPWILWHRTEKIAEFCGKTQKMVLLKNFELSKQVKFVKITSKTSDLTSQLWKWVTPFQVWRQRLHNFSRVRSQLPQSEHKMVTFKIWSQLEASILMIDKRGMATWETILMSDVLITNTSKVRNVNFLCGTIFMRHLVKVFSNLRQWFQLSELLSKTQRFWSSKKNKIKQKVVATISWIFDKIKKVYYHRNWTRTQKNWDPQNPVFSIF